MKSDEGTSSGLANLSPEKILGILILVFLFLGVVWYSKGGPQHPPEETLFKKVPVEDFTASMGNYNIGNN